MSTNIKDVLQQLLMEERAGERGPWQGQGNRPGVIQKALLELEELEAAQDMLNALHAAGVDNWEGYESAMEDQS